MSSAELGGGESRTVTVSAPITPGGGTVVLTNIPVMDNERVVALRDAVQPGDRPQLLVKMRAVASRLGGEIESGEFIYAITLCNGCLVRLVQSCPEDIGTLVPANACGLPQDEPTTCCQSSAGVYFCPSAADVEAAPEPEPEPALP